MSKPFVYIPDKAQIRELADIYVDCLLHDPWYEDNDIEKVTKYFNAFTNSTVRYIFGLSLNGKAVGVAVGEIVPCPDAPFFRIEDFCIKHDMHLLGLGSFFIKNIEEKTKELGCNCVLLTTVRDFGPHKFYCKNGFKELDNSVYLYKEI